MTLDGKRILLIISGGVAAYKALELARRLMDVGADVRGVLTPGGAQFITPLSVAALTGNPCYTDLFSLKDEAEMGHIQLSRDADLILVAPASADLMAKMAAGIAGDLATTLLLATDKPVMVAPAMNLEMWAHAATQRNVEQLQNDGIHFIMPGTGMMACGEVGAGRLAEVPDMVAAVEGFWSVGAGSLTGKHIIVTAGPTQEAIDPVRYIANRSSGRQGYAIAASLVRLGAKVTLVSGPTSLAAPSGVNFVQVESAREMAVAVDAAIPADAAICVAAVADWHITNTSDQKMKKSRDGIPQLEFADNPDILQGLSTKQEDRPALVVGFAAETQDVIRHASEKRLRKGCDWIVANDVSANSGVMGGCNNQVHLIDDSGADSWPQMTKEAVAAKLATKIASALDNDLNE